MNKYLKFSIKITRVKLAYNKYMKWSINLNKVQQLNSLLIWILINKIFQILKEFEMSLEISRELETSITSWVEEVLKMEISNLLQQVIKVRIKVMRKIVLYIKMDSIY